MIKGITPVIQVGSKVVDAKKRKVDSIPLDDVYDLSVDALTLLGSSVYEFSMKRREMLKSEVAPAYKSLCHELQPIAIMLFDDELPQSIRNISEVKRMAVKSVNHDRRSSSLAFVYTNFKKPRVVSSRGRQYADHGRSNLNFKAPLRVPQASVSDQLSESPVAPTPISQEFQYNDQATVISQTQCSYPQVGGRLAKFFLFLT